MANDDKLVGDIYDAVINTKVLRYYVDKIKTVDLVVNIKHIKLQPLRNEVCVIALLIIIENDDGSTGKCLPLYGEACLACFRYVRQE